MIIEQRKQQLKDYPQGCPVSAREIGVHLNVSRAYEQAVQYDGYTSEWNGNTVSLLSVCLDRKDWAGLKLRSAARSISKP